MKIENLKIGLTVAAFLVFIGALISLSTGSPPGHAILKTAIMAWGLAFALLGHPDAGDCETWIGKLVIACFAIAGLLTLALILSAP